jgi:L-cystine uptake protein TcyP (sodium:dicarboxylate symporter family)
METVHRTSGFQNIHVSVKLHVNCIWFKYIVAYIIIVSKGATPINYMPVVFPSLTMHSTRYNIMW